jgi:hypothetical protein
MLIALPFPKTLAVVSKLDQVGVRRYITPGDLAELLFF